MCAISVCSWAPTLARKREIKHWLFYGAEARTLGVRSRDYQIFWNNYLPMVIRCKKIIKLKICIPEEPVVLTPLGLRGGLRGG